MKFKISSKTFSKAHLRVLERYLNSDNFLHIVGGHSQDYKNLNNTYNISPNVKISDQIDGITEYDTLIFTNYFESSSDIFSLLTESKSLLTAQGKLIVSVVNYRYSFIIKFLEFVGIKEKSPRLSHIQENHIVNLAKAAGLDFINSHTKQFIPFKLFGFLTVFNSLLELIFSKYNFGIVKYIVFKNHNIEVNNYKKTVIIPAKNEEGNIPILFSELDKLNIDEIIFSIGESKDNTEEVLNNCIEKYKNLNVISHQQTKKGKANAIWESFPHVTGDIVAILDSDLSVEPHELDNFYSILENNYADFVNGTRLIYPMEKESMRKINFFGNRLFQAVVSFITGEKLSDSLCGTKVFKKEFISKISWWQDKYLLFDPFCDFDLIFTASITGEKIIEYPVHYKSRIYGQTQISRFRDGFKLIVYLLKSYKIFNSSSR